MAFLIFSEWYLETEYGRAENRTVVTLRRVSFLGAGTSVTAMPSSRNPWICHASSPSKENVTKSTVWSRLICLRRLNVRIFPPVSAGKGNLGAMKRIRMNSNLDCLIHVIQQTHKFVYTVGPLWRS